MTTTVTIRPNAVVSGTVTLYGAPADAPTGLSDNVATTGVGSLVGTLELSFPTPTIPAGSEIISVTLRARGLTRSGLGTTQAQKLTLTLLTDTAVGSYGEQLSVPYNAESAITGTTRTTKADGTDWTAADLATGITTAQLRSNHNAVAATELYIDIVYDTKPVASNLFIVSSATPRPSFNMSFSDADGDAKTFHQLRIFKWLDTQVVGFDPNTAASYVWDSGAVAGTATTNLGPCGVDLQDGELYAVYGRVASGTTTTTWSDWVVGTASFTPIYTRPADPVVTPTVESNRIRLDVAWSDAGNVWAEEKLLVEWMEAAPAYPTNMLAPSLSAGESAVGITVEGQAQVPSTNTGFGLTSYGVLGTALNAGAATWVFPAVKVSAGRRFLFTLRAQTMTSGGFLSTRTVGVGIRWYNAANVLITTTTGTTGPTNSWSPLGSIQAVDTAPTGAVSCRPFATLTATAASDRLYMDELAMYEVLPGENFLKLADADFFSGAYFSGAQQVGNWVNDANASLSAGTIEASTRYGNLVMQATAAATMTAKSGAVTQYAVNRSVQHTVRARFRTSVTSRLCRVGVRWYNASSTLLTTDWSTTVADNAGSYTEAVVKPVSPSTAAYAVVVLEVQNPVLNEIHYVDEVMLTEGDVAAYRQPGDRVWTRGSQWPDEDWHPVPLAVLIDPASSGTTTVYDYAARATDRYYRARVVSGNASTSYGFAGPIQQPAYTTWQLKDLFDPNANINGLEVMDKFVRKVKETQATYHPIGRKYPVTVSDVVGGEDGHLKVDAVGAAAYAAVKTMFLKTSTLLLQSPYGEQWFIRFQDETNIDLSPISPYSQPYYVFDRDYVETSDPMLSVAYDAPPAM